MWGFSQTVFAACVDITKDLGLNQVNTTNDVIKLQTFLKNEGYFSGSATGTFGPATTASVKKFQNAQKIASTGLVGALTRAAIKAKTCTAQSTIVETVTTPKKYIITLPAEGSIIPLESTQKIRWNGTIKINNTLILENEQGVSQGYIALNGIENNQFDWKAGTVFSTQSQSEVIVDPGIYRIRIRSAYSGTTADDPLSAFFTLTTPTLKTTYVYPHTVRSQEATTVVLYGSGFNAKTRVSVDGPSHISTERLYSSPDGTTYMFVIPKTLSFGSHKLWIYNGYEHIDSGLSVIVE